MNRRVRIIGNGRAGGSLARALAGTTWTPLGPLGRGDDATHAASGVDAVVVAVPDGAIADVAQAIRPEPTTVILHLSGASTLARLAPHRRVGSLHPLVSLASPTLGAAKLRGAWFAVAGDPVARELVTAIGGQAFDVAEEHRAIYHATACVAANHLVALMGQVERLAALTGAPRAAFDELARGSLDNVIELGDARAALTGPIARGDWSTVAAHLRALPADELDAYLALARETARLAERDWPDHLPTAE